MKDEDKTKEQLTKELAELRQRVAGLEAADTERERAEETLRENEELCSNIVESMSDGILVLDRDFHYTYWNRAMERISGIPRGEVIGNEKVPWEIFPHLAEQGVDEMMRKAMQGEVIQREDIPYRLQSGKSGFTSETFLSLRSATGEVRGVIGVVHDITERKRAEEALAEERNLLRTLIDNLPDYIYVKDTESQFVTSNIAVARQVGATTLDEVIGKTDFDFFPEELAAQYYANEQTIIQSGQPLVDGEELVIDHAGNKRWVLTTKVPLRDNQGQIVGLVGMNRDITERKRAEEELQRTLERLREALGGIIQTVVLTVETKDPYTAGHQRRVGNLARAIANEMGLPQEQIDGTRIAGLIHDLGKVGIPAEVLSRPGRLSDFEWGMIKMHSQIGYDILKKIEFPWPVAQIVLQHHERIDGTGYPQGLSGEEIMLEARILGVADVVEAMASFRPYRPALGIDKALEEVSQNKGILYDPEVVDACLKLFTEKGFTFDATPLPDFAKPAGDFGVSSQYSGVDT